MEIYIAKLEQRAGFLKDLHSKQIDDRENTTIATRSETLGRFREVRKTIKELKEIVKKNKDIIST